MTMKDIITLNFYKNIEGKYHCPVMYKVFNDSSYIVAIKTTGNVYCFEAVKELNIKTNNYKDLLTNEDFKKEDIITLQKPNQLKETNTFYHVINNRDISTQPHVNVNPATQLMMKSIRGIQQKQPIAYPNNTVIKVSKDSEPTELDLIAKYSKK